jgi:hypothetical protein
MDALIDPALQKVVRLPTHFAIKLRNGWGMGLLFGAGSNWD